MLYAGLCNCAQILEKQEEERRKMMRALIGAFTEKGYEVIGLGNYSFNVRQAGLNVVVCSENILSGEVEFTTLAGVGLIKIGQGDCRYLDAAIEICEKQ